MPRTQVVQVHIPAGVDDGQALRVPHSSQEVYVRLKVSFGGMRQVVAGCGLIVWEVWLQGVAYLCGRCVSSLEVMIC